MSGLTGMPPPQKQNMFQVVVIDDAVAKYFPEGSTLVSAKPHGASFWTRTARIDLELSDKTRVSYFMKVATGEVGLGMLKGEFHGVAALHKFVPDGIPRPVGYGTYEADSNTHFYLCDFIDMIEELPDIHKFSAMLGRLHHDSMVSPSAPKEFGFPVVTYEGTMYQDVTWCKTWEESFIRHLQAFIDQERVTHGPSEELEGLLVPFLGKVIPRLLRPLQTHGRDIRPVLVHGDIWYGNMATNAETGDAIFFDPAVFWGHNEYDLDNMNVVRYRMGVQWMREYHKHFPISSPEEDYEDRIAIYAIRGHFCASCLYPDNANFRKMLINEIRGLVEKYPDGYQGE